MTERKRRLGLRAGLLTLVAVLAVVAAGCGHFQSALDVLLALDLGEIHQGFGNIGLQLGRFLEWNFS